MNKGKSKVKRNILIEYSLILFCIYWGLKICVGDFEKRDSMILIGVILIYIILSSLLISDLKKAKNLFVIPSIIIIGMTIGFVGLYILLGRPQGLTKICIGLILFAVPVVIARINIFKALLYILVSCMIMAGCVYIILGTKNIIVYTNEPVIVGLVAVGISVTKILMAIIIVISMILHVMGRRYIGNLKVIKNLKKEWKCFFKI